MDDLKPLDRAPTDYERVMAIWLAVPGLNHNERTMIRTFQQSLTKGLADFEQVRRIATQPAFLPTLQSAANKAIAAGVLIHWTELDNDQAA